MTRMTSKERSRMALRDSAIQTTAAHDALMKACARLDEVNLTPQTRYRLTLALQAMNAADTALQKEYTRTLKRGTR